MIGYGHFQYAHSFTEWGMPRNLPQCGGWVLERAIPGSVARDAMGCYPLFVCNDWSRLYLDLEDLRGKLVSIALVADPFGEHDDAYLKDTFKDVCVPFKEHFVVDLSRPLETYAHAHHRRNARKALREVMVAECANPESVLNDWNALYGTLIERHGIAGMTAFSRESFAKQLAVPGLVVIRATHDGATVGMLLWYARADVAYYHLGAYSERGYELRASFALFSHSIEYFAERGLRWLDLGGAAGAGAGGASGLGRFKEGWSTGVRTAYFCGRILDPEKYAEIVRARNAPPTNYFPAYRFGEFR